METRECLERLANYISGEYLIVGYNTSVLVRDFLGFFGDTEFGLESLKNRDGGKLGYTAFFERLKNDGVLE